MKKKNFQNHKLNKSHGYLNKKHTKMTIKI